MDEEKICKQYRQKILILIRMKTNYHPDSEDICQDVLEAVMQAVRKKKINDPEKMPAYVNRICSNKITDWLRKNYSNKEDLTDFQADRHKIINPDQNALDKLIQDEERNKLDRSLKSLNIRERKILYLHYYRTWSFEEIARFMDSKPETIRKTAERSRKKIAKKFKINY